MYNIFDFIIVSLDIYIYIYIYIFIHTSNIYQLFYFTLNTKNIIK